MVHAYGYSKPKKKREEGRAEIKLIVGLGYLLLFISPDWLSVSGPNRAYIGQPVEPKMNPVFNNVCLLF